MWVHKTTIIIPGQINEKQHIVESSQIKNDDDLVGEYLCIDSNSIFFY